MKLKTLFIMFIVFIIFIVSVTAGDPFRVDENMELGQNDIYNATNINSTYFYQDGNLVLDSTDEANLNVNHSNSTGYIEWSGILNKFITAVDDIYVYMSGTTATLNETKLNNTIQANPKNWTYLQNYPSACPAGSYITQLDDSVTCTAALKTTGDDGEGHYNFTSARINNTLRIGNSSSAILDAPTNTYLRIGDVATTSNSLDANDDLQISGELEVDGVAYFDGWLYSDGNMDISGGRLMMRDNTQSTFGSGNDAAIEYDTAQTNDTLMLGTSTDSENFIICQKGDMSYNFDHSASVDPTLIIHSRNQTPNEYISIYHNTSDGIIDVGTGDIILNDNAEINGNLDMNNNNITNISTLFGDGSYISVGDYQAAKRVTGDDDLFVSKTLEVGHSLNVDRILVIDAYPGDGTWFQMANNGTDYFGITMKDNSTSLAVTNDSGRNLNIIDYAWKNDVYKFNQEISSDPTLRLYSATNPNIDDTEWLSLTYKNATDRAEFEVGKGDIAFLDNIDMTENNITNVTNYQYLSNPGLTGNYSINASACYMTFGGGILYATNCATI